MSGAVDKRANIRVTAKTDQAASEIDKLAKSQARAQASLQSLIDTARKQNFADRMAGFDKAAASVAKSDATMSAFSKTTSGLGAAFGKAALGAGAFIAAAGAAANAVGEMANRSMEVQGVFQNLSFSIELARESTRGLITDFDLAKSANQLVSFGVVNNAKDFAELARAAQALGQKMGTGTTQAMESLSAALGRSSKLMLDNLGIILNETKAQDQYARSLGKLAKDLTENEKAEAFRKEAMKAIIATSREVTVVTDGTAASLVRLQVELQNVRDRALGGGPAALSLADGIAKLDEKTRKLVEDSRYHGASLREVQAELRNQGVALSDLTDAYQPYIDALMKVRKLEKEKAAATQVTDLLKVMEGSVAAIDKIVSTERLRDIERELAMLGTNAKTRDLVNDLLEEKARLTAAQLELEGKLDEAEAVRFNEEIRQIKEYWHGNEKRIGSTKRLTAEQKLFNAELAKAKAAQFGGKLGTDSPLERGFDEGLRASRDAVVAKDAAAFRKTMAEEAASDERRKQDSILEVKLQGLDRERELGVDPWSIAQREADARLASLESHRQYIEATQVGKDKEIALEELASQKRQVMHDRELSRIAKERRAEEARVQRKKQLLDFTISMTNTGVELGNLAAKAAGLSAQKQKIVGDVLAGGQLMTIGTVEMVKAAADFASQNYLGGAMHTAASVLAFAKGGMLLSSAGAGGGGGGGGGGFSGASFGPAMTGGGGGMSGGGTEQRELGKGPPISRVAPLPPPPRGTSGPKRAPIEVHFHSLMTDSATIGELRKVLARHARDEGDVN